MNVKIASWNIAGGYPLGTLKQFDYSAPDLSYFIEKLRQVDADIICLQESHTSEDNQKSNAQDIADALGYPYVFNSVASNSHIEKGQKLSTAILSRLPVTNEKCIFFPDPSAPLVWRDGRPAGEMHHKNMQVVKTEKFSIANNQMLPIHLFSLGYDDGGVGSELAQGIHETMAANVTAPVLWCGDFNFEEPLSIYPHLRNLKLTEALPDVNTRPAVEGAKKRTDHIFYSSEFTLVDSGVEIVNADHYLCWAEFEMK
ncbi:MAG: endonuclease/exonuclease/phosphatase family protein [Patescibacteria group bacterium]